MQRLLFILVLVMARLTFYGQSMCRLRHYDEYSGMSQWYVTQIVQDNKGMMWFATWNGMDRFDGVRFENFKSCAGDGSGMVSDRICDVIKNKDGNFWCLVDDRVFLFNPTTCKFSRLSYLSETKLLDEFKRHRQLFVSYSPLVYNIAAKHGLTHLTHDNNYFFHLDKYGTLWIIGYDGTISYIERNSVDIKKYPVDESFCHAMYSTTDSGGNLWFRSNYGMFELSFLRKPYKQLKQTVKSQVRCFYLDNKKRYWVTTKEDSTVRVYSHTNVLLGYLGADGKLHRAYTVFRSPVYSISQSHDGLLWLGSKPGGLYRLKEENGAFVIKNYRYDVNNIYSISNNQVYDIKEDRMHRLWIATMGGGINCMISDGKFINYRNLFRGYPKNKCFKIRSLLITHQFCLLAAGTDGLLVADIGSNNYGGMAFRLHHRETYRASSLSSSAAMFLFRDSQNHIFVCTESGGVNQILSHNLLLPQLQFRHFNMTNGLPSDVALSMFEFKHQLWIVSSNQLIKFDPNKNVSYGFDYNFWNDRFRFSDASPLFLLDGRYVFGLQNGAFTVDISGMRRSAFVPPIAITGISIQNESVNRAVNSCDTIVLLPGHRSVTVYFAALDYSDADKIEYEFMFGSEVKKWNHIRKNRSATFLDLHPGTYVLKIRSTNSDGAWVDNERMLTIIVKPTFWETRIAFFMYIFIVIGIIGAIFRTCTYIRHIKRQQKETLEAYLSLLDSKPERIVEDKHEDDGLMSKAKIKAEDDVFMKRIITFIDERLSDDSIGIGDMADAAATSRSGLNRKMKSMLGVTPLDFLRQARIQKACQLLKRANVQVNDVAYECGFSDPNYFGKSFKSIIGMTPSEYKAQNETV